jgi:hypothetical protein
VNYHEVPRNSWRKVKRQLPLEPHPRQVGPPRVAKRAVLNDIWHVLWTRGATTWAARHGLTRCCRDGDVMAGANNLIHAQVVRFRQISVAMREAGMVA